jgi:cytochrome c oxidase assembly protein subunit 15
MSKRAIWAKRMAILSAVGMFIVLLMGARVTATGSGDGCGNDWPLCHGGFLPADTFESLTEYSHRFVTGVEGFVVLATTILAWPLRKRHRAFKVLIPAMMGTLVLQSLMGAAAVRWPTSPEVMASHFGISLICLASASLVAFILIEDQRPVRERAGVITANTERAVSGIRWLIILTLVFSIVVAYSGAYVRHTESELACSTWPTCTGEIVPRIDDTPPGIQTLHRTLAGVITLLIAAVAIGTYRLRAVRPDLQMLGVAAAVIVVLQSMVGAIVVFSGLQLLATLSHAALMAALFVVLSEGGRRVWPSRVSQRVVSGGSIAHPATGD